MAQHPTNPIPDTLESVPHYPDHLKIYRIPSSRYWYARCSLDNKRVVRSMKTVSHANAISSAIDFYKDLLVKQHTNQPLTQGSSFKRAAEASLEQDRAKVARGDNKQSTVDDAEYLLKSDLLPFFKNTQVKDITALKLQDYTKRLQQRNLTSKTISNHYNQLRKILNQAVVMGMITTLPPFPDLKIIANPRSWFNDDQYARLLQAIRKAIKDKMVVRSVPITDALYDFVTLMEGTFLRVTDMKDLQNKQIEVVRKIPDHPYLKIMAHGKVKPSPVVSTEAAVWVYENHLKRGDLEAYLFFPEYSREHALQTLSRQFRYVLEQADLYKVHGTNQTRELGSLRHTAIMRQLLHGGLPIATLARNCRTSIEMIQKHYGSHLQAEMSIHQMYQYKEPADSLEDLFE